MVINQFQCLEALGQAQDFARAARACDVSVFELVEAIRGLERQYGHPILQPGLRFDGFTPQGEKVLAWARAFSTECTTLRQDLKAGRNEASIATLLERRSVSPKRLRAPGPGSEDIDMILQAALRAPDHGGLHPWRVIEFRAEQRAALADRFEQEKLRRDPLASATDRRLAREHATRAPALLAFVVTPRARSKVPAREQWLAAGAALGNLLNAVHQLGFGAIILSGERCFDPELTTQLGIRPEEFLAGFISLGTVSEMPPSKKHTLPGEVWTCWTPPAEHKAAAGAAHPAESAIK